jgi:protein TonB
MADCPGSQEEADFLGDCLIESDSEFEARARKIKRRALVASILLQVLIAAVLVLVPLLSNGESIAAYSVTPAPPYHRGTVGDNRPRARRPPADGRRVCTDCFRNIPAAAATADRRQVIADPDPGDLDIPGTPEGQMIPGSLDVFNVRRAPEPPPDKRISSPPTRRNVSEGVQAARLVHRVEPIYPPLARQIRREGRVQLRAIIATDGRMKSLEVVSGEPLFIQSALTAVQEWRYQPTLLSGEPIEIETYITVVYTLDR